jgi:hypothetical protein
MDKALATQLKRGRLFKKGSGRDSEEGYFANHYPHFGAIQCSAAPSVSAPDVVAQVVHPREFLARPADRRAHRVWRLSHSRAPDISSVVVLEL